MPEENEEETEAELSKSREDEMQEEGICSRLFALRRKIDQLRRGSSAKLVALVKEQRHLEERLRRVELRREPFSKESF